MIGTKYTLPKNCRRSFSTWPKNFRFSPTLSAAHWGGLLNSSQRTLSNSMSNCPGPSTANSWMNQGCSGFCLLYTAPLKPQRSTGSGLGCCDMVSAFHWRLSRMKNGELPYSRPKKNVKMEVIAKFFINFKRFRSIIDYKN